VDGELVTGPTGSGEEDFGPALAIWEGWAADPVVRRRGSSGGVLTALALYCLERAGYCGVIHAGMDPDQPWMNRSFVSRSREEVLARCGSRYSPSSPVEGLNQVEGERGPFLFIGKPCDAAAVSELRSREPAVGRRIPMVATFFCAGTPSTDGTLNLMAQLGVQAGEAKAVHYRGDGWPGEFRVCVENGGHGRWQRMSYAESWGKLTSYRPLRCNLCPDGTGQVADIACGDAWHNFEVSGSDPGRSLILARSEAGRSLVLAAVSAGWIVVEASTRSVIRAAQPSLLGRRVELFGRLLGLRLLGAPTPEFSGFGLRRMWASAGLGRRFRSVAGTWRRGLQRRWWARALRGNV
jgi:coenzyme F420 hydrogenase subunit beta